MKNSAKHPCHSMCSYLGGFPPKVPRRLIERWIGEQGIVLDPFCGAGTTLVEAKRLGRRSVGMDLNPLAVALARAKTQTVSLEDVKDRLTSLASEFGGETELDEAPEELAPIYHRRTLAQLCYLRRALTSDAPEDVFLRGALLGIMHGKARRDGSTAYLSVDMPNTFSMSARYVRDFVRRKDLRAPPVDVFEKLRQRAAWLLRDGPIPDEPECTVLIGDATKLTDSLAAHGLTRVDGIVTSPPYLGVLRYGAFNWIRLWFLGYDQYSVDKMLQTTDSLDIYLSFMVSFLCEASNVVETGAKVALVIGDVSENGQYMELGERVWEEMAGVVPFELESREVDGYDSSVKTTRVWGEKRKGQATPRDRVIVLRKTGGISGTVGESREAKAGAV